MAYAQSLDRSLLAHPTSFLSVGQIWSGVRLVAHRLYIPALEGQGFPANSDKT
jgi:hypothetical protein